MRRVAFNALNSRFQFFSSLFLCFNFFVVDLVKSIHFSHFCSRNSSLIDVIKGLINVLVNASSFFSYALLLNCFCFHTLYEPSQSVQLSFGLSVRQIRIFTFFFNVLVKRFSYLFLNRLTGNRLRLIMCSFLEHWQIKVF